MSIGTVSSGAAHVGRAGKNCLKTALLTGLFCAAALSGGCGEANVPAGAMDTPSPTAVFTPAPTPEPTPTPVPTPVPVALTAFVPDAYGQNLVRVATTIAEDTPLALIDELVRLGTLPDIDYGRTVYFEVSDSYVKIKGGKQAPRVVARLDVSDRFLSALLDLSKREEQLCLQGLANTFITHYNAETFMLTVNGVKLVTNVRDYESGLSFDQYAKTARED